VVDRLVFPRFDPIESRGRLARVSTIKKAIQLKVLLRVEGEQAAPDDFAALATRAIAEALKDVRVTVPQPLSITVQRIVEYSSDDEEDDDDAAS
jgi:hypothetical protein